MALRQVGSSLVAKASPGATYRETSEQRITKPEIPGKGGVGTVQRGFLETPFELPVPGGSQKIIRVAPSIESAATPAAAAPAAEIPALAAGVGLPESAGQPQLRSAGANQPMFQGGVSPAPSGAVNPPAPKAAPATRGGKAPSVVASGGELASARSVKAAGIPEASVMGAATEFQAPRPQEVVGSFWPGVGSLGGRAAAGEETGTHEIPKNFGQAVVGTLGNLAQSIGTAIRAPELNIGERAQAFATNPKVTQTGTGSISKPGGTLNAISNVLRSLIPQQTAKTSPSYQASGLRSQQSSPITQLRSAASNVANTAKNAVSSLASKVANLFKRK